jgi:hypothetical protein
VYFNEVIKGGSVFHEGRSARPLEITPFTLGGAMGSGAGLEFGTSVRRWLTDDRISAKYEGRRPTDGLSLDVVRFGVTGEEEPEVVYLIDAARGFLPVQLWIQRPDGTFSSKAFMTDIRQCAGDRWFPMRCVYFRSRSEGSLEEPGAVTILEVTELDVDHRPDDDAFVVSIPKGAALHDGEKLGSQITLDRNAEVDLDHAERLYDATQSAHQSYELRMRQLRDEADGQNSSYAAFVTILSVNLIIIAVVGIAYVVHRRRKRQIKDDVGGRN